MSSKRLLLTAKKDRVNTRKRKFGNVTVEEVNNPFNALWGVWLSERKRPAPDECGEKSEMGSASY